jgi:hypothetical protein
MKPHLVVAIGLVARDGVQTFLDQFLDELIRQYQTPAGRDPDDPEDASAAAPAQPRP